MRRRVGRAVAGSAHNDASKRVPSAPVTVAPRTRRAFSRNYDGRMRGESYPAEWYDNMIGAALRHVAASAKLMTETMPKALAPEPTQAGDFTGARIVRDRQAAMTRYMRDRDVGELQATMSRLDSEQSQAQERVGGDVTPERARHYLANLSELWADTEPEGQRAIAAAAVDRIEVMGLDLVIHPSDEAERYGWSEAFGSKPLVCSISRTGRGERF